MQPDMGRASVLLALAAVSVPLRMRRLLHPSPPRLRGGILGDQCRSRPGSGAESKTRRSRSNVSVYCLFMQVLRTQPADATHDSD